MKIYISKNNDPYFNLSLEEVLLKDQSQKEDIIMFYQNQNTIVIGQNQNTFVEVNQNYVEKHHVKIARRISGGGAVYHDLGNINFSFITNNLSQTSYQNFLNPIIDFLKSFGLNAQFKGRNDVVIDGKKISGNAQFKYKNRMFHHGTLLYDTDISILGQALKTRLKKVQAKGIKSNIQRVVNIKTLINPPITTSEFFAKMVAYFMEQNATELIISQKEIIQAQELAKERSSWEWIYGKSLQYQYSNEVKYPGGILSVSLITQKGLITEISFEGDFLSKKNVRDIELKFQNLPLKKMAIKTILSTINISDYFGSLSAEEIILTIFNGEHNEKDN